MRMARLSCLVLDRQEAPRAFSRAWAKTGKRIAARIAMMAITTSNSIRVNPRRIQRNMVGSLLLIPRLHSKMKAQRDQGPGADFRRGGRRRGLCGFIPGPKAEVL